MISSSPSESPPSSSRLMDLMVNDQGFVFDPATGETYQVTPTALMCLKLLQAGEPFSVIVAKIASDWDASDIQIASDLDFFMLQIKGLRWI